MQDTKQKCCITLLERRNEITKMDTCLYNCSTRILHNDFPICSLIALMDWGNGKTYRENLREVMGMKQK